jgi:ABC-type Na+ efflux pump permease subunit
MEELAEKLRRFPRYSAFFLPAINPAMAAPWPLPNAKVPMLHNCAIPNLALCEMPIRFQAGGLPIFRGLGS